MPHGSVTTELLRRLDPSAPTTPSTHISRTWPGAPRRWSWPERLQLLAGAGAPRLLLHGYAGVGKSTELQHWESTLESSCTVLRVTVSPEGADSPAEVISRLHAAAIRHLRPKIPQFNAALQQLGTAWAVLRQHEPELPTVLLVDGLDTRSSDQAQKLFGHGTSLAGDELPAVVFCAPTALALGDEHDGRFDTVHVPPFPVLTESGTTDVAATAHVAAGLARRLDGLVHGITTDQFGQVALAAAGVLRDALRILRGAVLAAHGHDTVSRDHLDEGVRDLRQDLEHRMRRQDLAELRDLSRRARFTPRAHLLTSGLVLAYEGAEHRYFVVHPTLRGLLDGTDCAPAVAA